MPITIRTNPRPSATLIDGLNELAKQLGPTLVVGPADAAILEDPRHDHFWALEAGVPVGFLSIFYTVDLGRRIRATANNLVVDAAYREEGIGRDLLTAGINEVRDSARLNKTTIPLTAAAHPTRNAVACKLLEHAGFTRVAVAVATATAADKVDDIRATNLYRLELR